MISADFLVFSDKDRKLSVPFQSTFPYVVPMGGKTYGDVDPSSVANLSWAGWIICKERSWYRDNLKILLKKCVYMYHYKLGQLPS